jgi:hypothetical protein
MKTIKKILNKIADYSVLTALALFPARFIWPDTMIIPLINFINLPFLIYKYRILFKVLFSRYRFGFKMLWENEYFVADCIEYFLKFTKCLFISIFGFIVCVFFPPIILVYWILTNKIDEKNPIWEKFDWKGKGIK